MLTRLRIGPKLLLAPGAVLLVLLMLSYASYHALVRQNASLDSIIGARAASLRAAAELATQSQKVHADTYRLLGWMGGSFPLARTEPLRQDILLQLRKLDAGLVVLGKGTATPGEARQIAEAGHAQRRYAKAVREVLELAPLDGSIGANAMQKADQAFAQVALRLAALARLEESLARQAAQQARADVTVISLLLPGGIGLAIALALALTLAVRRILLDEIGGIRQAASGLASGDLTLAGRGPDHAYGADEVGAASRQLDASIRNLGGALRSIGESARLIGAASCDIKMGNLSLGSRAVFRASALARAGRSMEELAAGATMSALEARAVGRLASGTACAAGRGEDLVERLVTTLGASRRGAQQVVEIVDRLEQVANEAGTLALNSALDAARGEGRGADDPTAVAAQVRALARRVAGAGRDIRAVMAQSVADIDGGMAWAQHAGASIDGIAGVAREVEDIARRIGASSDAQAVQLGEVNVAIVQMDQVTRQNCALVEAAAAAARTLQMQALALSRTVAGFRLEEEGSPGGAMEHGGAPLEPARERQRPGRERRRQAASHLRLASSRK